MERHLRIDLADLEAAEANMVDSIVLTAVTMVTEDLAADALSFLEETSICLSKKQLTLLR